jgi:outer membrane receptor protein involved in Fe transport
MERPANIIEPSFNVQMDSGLRWDIGSDWKGSVSFQWNRYRDRPVTVVSTTSGRLTQTPWGKGEEQQWMLQLRGTPSGSSWYTDLTVLYRTSSWSDPNIDFTPFVPRTTIKLRGERRFGLWKTSLQFLHEGQRKAFPSEKTLDARNTFDADISWNPLASTELRLSIQNLLNQTSEWAPGLEHAPLRGVMELDFKF